MVSSKNCNGESQLEDPFPTTLSARMLIPEERMCPPVRKRHTEKQEHTHTHTQRKRDRDGQIDTHIHAVSSNHHGHSSTAELTRRKRDFHAFMLINGVDLILTMKSMEQE